MYMGEKQKREFPFKTLGSRLRRLRVSSKESIAEVSGAVEIDVAMLTEIEEGTKRPTEDILLLLISHFAIKDEEATRLWDLARYNQPPLVLNQEELRPIAGIVPLEAPIVYTDMMHVMVNNYGVVMNFMQGTGPNSQPVAIARVGMSREHARSVLEILQKTLDQDIKKLPTSDTQSDKQTRN